MKGVRIRRALRRELRGVAALLALSNLFVVSPARSASDEGSGSESTAPSRRPVRQSFDERPGWGLEMGGGPWGRAAVTPRQATWMAGATLALGAHFVVRYEKARTSDKFSWPTDESLRWCMPVACGIVGMLFAPIESFAGNAFGLDVRTTLHGQWGIHDGIAGRVVLRPHMRYARGKFRTGTLLGSIVPEAGLAWSGQGRPSVVLGWVPYPIDFLVGPLAFTFDTMNVGFAIPLNGDGNSYEVGVELTIRWIPLF